VHIPVSEVASGEFLLPLAKWSCAECSVLDIINTVRLQLLLVAPPWPITPPTPSTYIMS